MGQVKAGLGLYACIVHAVWILSTIKMLWYGLFICMDLKYFPVYCPVWDTQVYGFKYRQIVKVNHLQLEKVKLGLDYDQKYK